jgi:hypothetical protein
MLHVAVAFLCHMLLSHAMCVNPACHALSHALLSSLVPYLGAQGPATAR